MANDLVLSGLAQKASELQGAIAALERQVAARRADLAAVQAAIRLFSPDFDMRAVKVKRGYHRASPHFERGELTNRCRDALRDAEGEPVAAGSIVERAIADKGLPADDAKLRRDFMARVLSSMHQLLKAGTVERIGHGLGARWRVP